MGQKSPKNSQKMAQNGKNGKKYKSVVNFPVIFGAEMVDFWLKTKKKVDFSGPRPGLRHPFKKRGLASVLAPETTLYISKFSIRKPF